MKVHIKTEPSLPSAKIRMRAGFALIATISVMVLLVMIALAMLSLSSVELRSSRSEMAINTARANARMALMLAIGELQKSAGPDQRVTASASINPANTTQPHLLGVWESFKQSNTETTTMDYSAQKDGGFIQWLSSTTVVNKTSLTYPTQTQSNSVKLIDKGTVSEPSDPNAPSNYVTASAIDVSTSANGTGKYAWHVIDESQKANLTLNNTTPTTDADRIASLGTGGKSGFQIKAAYEELEALSDTDRGKLISLDSSELISFDPTTTSAFHYLTTGTKSLLVDVANGGYQKDLSLLFQNVTLPTDYVNRHIYSDSDVPVVPEPTRFSDYAVTIPSPDPRWSLLHSHYQLYRNVINSGGNFSVQASQNALFKKGTGYNVLSEPIKEINPDFSHQQQLQPVISNAQFIFSIAPSYDGSVGNEKLRVRFFTDVVFTLWNPYNVNLEFSDVEVEFYRFPVRFEFFRNGAPVTTEPLYFANIQPSGLGSEWGEQHSLPYRARLIGSNPGDKMVLKPGEYKLFGKADSSKAMQNLNHFREGIELREGWDPEQGFHIRNYLHGSTGNKIGKEADGSITRFFEVSEGDEITTKVSSGKLGTASSGFPETNNEEPAVYLKFFRGNGGSHASQAPLNTVKQLLDGSRTQIGAIELNMADADITSNLPTIDVTDIGTLTIPAKEAAAGAGQDKKLPLLIASMRLKTEQDYNENNPQSSSMWLHNGLTNPYFTNGMNGDQDVHDKTHQYEVTWEAMTSFDSIPTVEFEPSTGRSYGGSGVSSASGVHFAPFLQVPLAPATSMAQFSHAPLNTGGMAPFTTQIVGNSFASLLVPRDKKSSPGTMGSLVDHSYMANNTLFDGYFLSTAAAEQGALSDSSARNLNTVVSEFFNGTQKLRNPNFVARTSTVPTITAADYDTFAKYLYNDGAFNVNSTSEEAWALFLASGTHEALPILDMLTGSTTLSNAKTSDDVACSRFSPMIGDEIPKNLDDNDPERWSAHRRLTSAQITELAKNVVIEVKARGPFQSVAEFVNRRLDRVATAGNSGALQSAIKKSDLNADFEFGLSAPKNNDELTHGEASGSSSDGSASQITQADILNRLAPSITVRGDTFLIRTYGEATVGNHTSRVWCEALVQRGHEFIDNTQASTTDQASLNPSNQSYGRRFKIVSFRWLSEKEI